MSKGFGNLMRQAQQMKKRMEKLEEELAEKTVAAEAGQGSVKATVNGDGKLTAISLDPKVVDPDDPETLEDLVVVAVNEAITLAQAMKEEEMKKLTGGVNLPGLF